MRGFRLFAYLRTSGVQAVLIFLQVGERSSSVPPSAPNQVVRLRHLTKHRGSKTAAQTVSNPEVRQHHASFKLNVSLWALEFHLFPSQFRLWLCCDGSTSLCAKFSVSLSWFCSSQRRDFVLLGEHGSYVLATRRRVCCRKRLFFVVLVLAHDFESMVSWPWPAKQFFLFLGHGSPGPSLQLVH